MIIEVIFYLHEELKDYFFEKSVVVIDVLRATSTMITAFANGAKSIIPAASVEEAIKIAKNLERSTYLLCGEKNTKIIDGFDLGNSPLEFNQETVKGKKLILTTTNGTRVFNFLRHSKNVLIASFLNASTVVKKMIELDNSWKIICAGRNGFFDMSDAICAGLLINLASSLEKNLYLNDAGKISKNIYSNAMKNLNKSLKNTDHGKILIQNGFEKDIDFISQLDVFRINANFVNNNLELLP